MKRLDPEEKEILKAFEAGTLKRVSEVKTEIKQHRQYAAATLKKDTQINIRISSNDLRALQKVAMREGLPYQILISSVLHKFVEGRLTNAPGPQARLRQASG